AGHPSRCDNYVGRAGIVDQTTGTRQFEATYGGLVEANAEHTWKRRFRLLLFLDGKLVHGSRHRFSKVSLSSRPRLGSVKRPRLRASEAFRRCPPARVRAWPRGLARPCPRASGERPRRPARPAPASQPRTG